MKTTIAVEPAAHPEHIDVDERGGGIIVFMNRMTVGSREEVAEDVAFDEDRIGLKRHGVCSSSCVLSGGWRKPNAERTKIFAFTESPRERQP